jgi:hypothetical protein
MFKSITDWYMLITVLERTQCHVGRPQVPAELTATISCVMRCGIDQFENKALRLISGCRKQEGTGKWRKFCRYSLIGITWLITLQRGVKLTMGITKLNLRRSEVTKTGRICLKQPFPPLLPQVFLFASLQISGQTSIHR